MKYVQKLMLTSAALLLSTSVSAEGVGTAAEDLESARDIAQTSVDDELLLDLDAFEDGGTLSDEELNTHRARENIEVSQITINDQEQDGEVTDNIAIGNTNGDNLINGEAFSNSSGFLSTVQNTGNNVLIQNSTIINVSVEATTPAN